MLPIVLVVAVALLGWFLYPMARLHYTEQRKLDQLRTQLASIQQRNTRLKHEVDSLKTPQGVQAAAYDLGLARKGEQVWVTMPSGSKAATHSGSAAVRTATMAPDVWTQVLDTVFGVGK
jgi:cell division protein FtsB